MGRDGDGECKDFSKGVCFRGSNCKYRHVGEKAEPEQVPFCKDFQSDRGCHYESDNGRSCAFVHAPRAATEEYQTTGAARGAGAGYIIFWFIGLKGCSYGQQLWRLGRSGYAAAIGRQKLR